MAYRYFDLHNHTSLKPLIGGSTTIISCWQQDLPTKTEKKRRSKFHNYIQSDLTSLASSNVRISINALHPLEREIAQRAFFSTFTTRIKIKKLLKLALTWSTYFKQLTEEYKLIATTSKSHNRKKFEILKKGTDIDSYSRKGINTIMVLAVEGGHALQGKYRTPRRKKAFEAAYLENLKTVKSWDYPVLYLTLAHMAYNHLTGQAWGLPVPLGLNKKKALKRILAPFYTKQTKLTPLGKKVIENCLKRSGPHRRRILIDIKHMHIDARYQYYNMIKNNSGGYKHSIIASHIGLSGIATKAKAKLVSDNVNEDKKYRSFNPWSINICDDEIKIIHKSKGLIGLILDQRILGAHNSTFNKDIIALLGKLKNHKDKSVWHTGLFVLNMFHVVQVISSKTAWDIISIGSDYDGLIDPIDSCVSVNDFSKFEIQVKQQIPYLVPDYKKYLYGMTVNTVLRKVFWGNGYSFIKKHL